MFSFDSYKGQKRIAMLIDPDKTQLSAVDVEKIKNSHPDFVLVGGSQDFSLDKLDNVVGGIKKSTDIPVILFPGNSNQIHPQADALLGLSLLQSSTNDFIFQPLLDVLSDKTLSNVRIYYTPYMLLNTDGSSSVEKAINEPIDNIDDISKWDNYLKLIIRLNPKVVYLESGSGAEKTVSTDFISQARKVLSDTYLIVGGGVRSTDNISSLWNAGADCVVVGNHIEENPTFLEEMCKYRNQWSSQ